ncbi:hypothetical protein PAXINDRAFT_18627 [Paxillus involutus ATCC 200175]|uniref:Uncharacterized protein n=1 Tax=Paxillus involutus ATCC 200175 TaxID=664439 RepID=A0A0C9SNN3_PAXIN|nr:hypothetical protein PAXINDRAFT_18627 [Paxillus involutus ATCC 200175]
MQNGLYGLPRTHPLALRPTRTRNGHETAQSLPQGLRACQKGHVDPTRPNPLPEAYEHAERCTSTPDGPPAVPKANEHGKWPQNNAPTPPGPTSVPNGAHAPQPTHSLAMNSPDGHKRHVRTPNGAHRAQTAHPLSLWPPPTLRACEAAHVDPRMSTRSP